MGERGWVVTMDGYILCRGQVKTIFSKNDEVLHDSLNKGNKTKCGWSQDTHQVWECDQRKYVIKTLYNGK